MCIIHFETLDNTLFFYIGSSDWHNEVLLLPMPRERHITGPWDSLSPGDQIFLQDKQQQSSHQIDTVGQLWLQIRAAYPPSTQ